MKMRYIGTFFDLCMKHKLRITFAFSCQVNINTPAEIEMNFMARLKFIGRRRLRPRKKSLSIAQIKLLLLINIIVMSDSDCYSQLVQT